MKTCLIHFRSFISDHFLDHFELLYRLELPGPKILAYDGAKENNARRLFSQTKPMSNSTHDSSVPET